MSYWWQVLEISRESDKQTIKKAYASLLKKYHPETDPEGYQRLREAYNEALKSNHSKERQREHTRAEQVLTEIQIQEPLEKKVPVHILPINWQNEQLAHQKEILIKNNQEANAFMFQVQALYQDLERRDREEEWRKLLNSLNFWDLDTAQVIKKRLFEFLKEHYYLHSHIWELLENYFKWNLESAILLSGKETKTKRVLHLLQSKDKGALSSVNIPHYRFLEDIPTELVDIYREERDKGYHLLIANKDKEAYEALLQSYKYYDKDPELMRLMGECCIRLKAYDLAVEYFRKAYHKNPRDVESLRKLANLLAWVQGDCKEAIVYFNFYKALKGEDENVINGLGYCYYHVGEWENAKIYLEKLLMIRDDKSIRKYLAKTEAHLAGKSKRRLRKILLGTKKK